jgi:cytochrome c oxidase assembly factor CtaG
MIQFSLRTLLGALFAASACFALSSFNYLIGALLFVGGLAGFAAICAHPRTTRFAVFGAVAGAVVLAMGFFVVALARGEWPFVETYSAAHTSMRLARKLAIPIGGGVGLLMGLLMAQVGQGRNHPRC